MARLPTSAEPPALSEPYLGRVEGLGLSVIIPAYNEAPNIRAGALTQLLEFLRTCGRSFEVLVVDDGSDDETAAVTRAVAAVEPFIRLVQTDHGGKAHALVHGMRAAQGRIVLFSDMDQAIPIAEASKLLPWFDRGFDIVVGSRGFERRHASFTRRVISFGQLAARYVVLGFADIVDTQCGFKAFRREIVTPLFDRLVVYGRAADTRTVGPNLSPGFDVELLFAAKRQGLSIKEVPIVCDHRRGGGRPANVLRDSVRGLADLVAIRSAARRGRYG
jgi:dolichyl-phosphate beta-glucosyltransferase